MSDSGSARDGCRPPKAGGCEGQGALWPVGVRVYSVASSAPVGGSAGTQASPCTIFQKLGALNSEPALPSTSYLPATPSVVPASSYIPSSETPAGEQAAQRASQLPKGPLPSASLGVGKGPMWSSSPAGAGTDSLVEAWDGQTPSEGSMKAHQSEAWGWPTDLCTKTGDIEPEWTG